MNQRYRWLVIIFALLLPLGTLGWMAAHALTLSGNVIRIVERDCAFFADLGTIPLPTTAAPVARRIVDDARAAYNARCQQFGRLGPIPTAVPVPTLTPTRTR